MESGNHYSTLAPQNAMSLAFVVLTKCHGVAPTGKMFELTDSLGKKLFETISISLVCEACMKTDNPERCQHKLSEMPRWLSSAKMEVVKSLLVRNAILTIHKSVHC